MTTRPYDPDDYPGGLRCGACLRKMEPGDGIHDRELDPIGGIGCTTPVCTACIGKPITAVHPMIQRDRRVTLHPDGHITTTQELL